MSAGHVKVSQASWLGAMCVNAMRETGQNCTCALQGFRAVLRRQFQRPLSAQTFHSTVCTRWFIPACIALFRQGPPTRRPAADAAYHHLALTRLPPD